MSYFRGFALLRTKKHPELGGVFFLGIEVVPLA